MFVPRENRLNSGKALHQRSKEHEGPFHKTDSVEAIRRLSGNMECLTTCEAANRLWAGLTITNKLKKSFLDPGK
jgi:hypothetical protein